MSDTHNYTAGIVVPGGDVLIHSGDATVNGTVEEVTAFGEWFAGLPHRRKIFVAGNHDWLFQRDPCLAKVLLGKGVDYLEESSIEIEGKKFYGSPWQPRFYDWAFNLNRGPEMAAKWEKVPDDTDVLITHGPPRGILDAVSTPAGLRNEGCDDLRERIASLAANGRLKAHLFGHIHSGYGRRDEVGVTFINSSVCDEDYIPKNAPIVLDV